MDLKYQLHKECPKTHARLGSFQTPHNTIQPPIFMPVGTMASVKGVDPSALESLKATIILGNTYHLGIRPGVEVLEALGGMHTMAHWKGSQLVAEVF